MCCCSNQDKEGGHGEKTAGSNEDVGVVLTSKRTSDRQRKWVRVGEEQMGLVLVLVGERADVKDLGKND
jgi:hypothetical protein